MRGDKSGRGPTRLPSWPLPLLPPRPLCARIIPHERGRTYGTQDTIVYNICELIEI